MSTFHVFDTFCLTEIVTEEAGDGHQDPLRHEEGGRFSKRFKDFPLISIEIPSNSSFSSDDDDDNNAAFFSKLFRRGPFGHRPSG